MKKIKRIATMAIMFVYIFCISTSFVGCEKVILSRIRLYETEYFIYMVYDETSCVGILGLTDKGKEQEYLVIPETIDGKKVSDIGCSFGWEITKIKEEYGDAKYAQFKSEKLKKIFIISDVHMIRGLTFGYFIDKSDCPNLDGVFYMYSKPDNVSHPEVLFFRANLPGLIVSKDLGKWKSIGRIPTALEFTANVSYCYNYEDAVNEGYYWIDNYEYGEKIEYIPEKPIREGYVFDGWYKESECMNTWNFEVDTLPQAQYGEEGYELYQETKLYAKWIAE